MKEKLFLGIFLIVFLTSFGFCRETDAKDLKPSSVKKYDVEMQKELRVDKDNNLYHVYAVEKEEYGTYRLEKRFIGKKKPVKINTPDYVFYASFDGVSDNFYYPDKKGRIHYCNAKGKSIADFSTEELWDEISLLTGGVRVRRKNKICMISRNGYQNVKTIYAEYDIKKKKFTKKKYINAGDDVVDLKLYGKKIYGLKITGGLEKYGDKITDRRKHSIVVFDLSGRLLYELDFSYLAENYTNKNISETMDEYDKYHWDVSDIEEMSKSFFDVRDGYIYIATRIGIYRCKIGNRIFKKIVDLSGCEFTSMNWRNYLTSFLYVNKNKFAFTSGWYDEGGDSQDVYIVRGAK